MRTTQLAAPDGSFTRSIYLRPHPHAGNGWEVQHYSRRWRRGREVPSGRRRLRLVPSSSPPGSYNSGAETLTAWTLYLVPSILWATHRSLTSAVPTSSTAVPKIAGTRFLCLLACSKRAPSRDSHRRLPSTMSSKPSNTA